jgi:1,4-dihydroxy-2-naphthoate octaprenyltransferase
LGLNLIEEIKRLADITSRGGKVPPLYLYFVYILPGFVYSINISHRVNFIPFILVSIAILPLIGATNLFDDLFDYGKGFDKIESPNTRYRRHPVFYYNLGKGYLIKWAVIFSVIYFLLIFLISLRYGLLMNAIAIIGFLLGYGYTGPPFGYKYLGLGEAGVFLSTLAANGLISIAVLGKFYLFSLLFFLPFSLLISLLLFVGNFRDLEYDRNSGFTTLAVILGKKNSVLFTTIIFALFYASIVILYFLKIYGVFSLIDLTSAPLAYYLSFSWTRKDSLRFEQYVGPYIFFMLFLLILLLIL